LGEGFDRNEVLQVVTSSAWMKSSRKAVAVR